MGGEGEGGRAGWQSGSAGGRRWRAIVLLPGLGVVARARRAVLAPAVMAAHAEDFLVLTLTPSDVLRGGSEPEHERPSAWRTNRPPRDKFLANLVPRGA